MKCLLLSLCLFFCAHSVAQDLSEEIPDKASEDAVQKTIQDPTPSAFKYTLGLKIRMDDIHQTTQSIKLSPVVGLRYGKWRVGIGDGEEWLRFNSFRKEPTLSYQLIEKRNVDLGLSMRIYNLNTGEGFDAFESGRKTLRSRLLSNLRINRRWTAGIELTHDLLNRGDSSTVSLGVSYAWPLSNHSELSLNTGVKWATAEHWRTAAGSHRTGIEGLTTRIGSVGSGLSYKHSLSKQWAWFSILDINKDVGNVARLSGPNVHVSGQVGFLYFGR
jgi:hypothetical protein